MFYLNLLCRLFYLSSPETLDEGARTPHSVFCEERLPLCTKYSNQKTSTVCEQTSYMDHTQILCLNVALYAKIIVVYCVY